MACMEHWCSDCHDVVFNNESTGPRICPGCQKEAPRWNTFSDELPDREEAYDVTD